MAIGAEIFEFYMNGWPEGWAHDDSEIEIAKENGDGMVCALNLEENYLLSKFGWLYPEGERITEELPEPMTFAAAFNKWKKTRTMAILIVEVPKDQLDAAKAAIQGLGYKVK